MPHETEHNANPRLRNVGLALAALVIIAVIIEGVISWALVCSSAEKSTGQLLEQIESVLDNNASDEEAQTEELKHTYISYARAVARLLDADPSSIESAGELQQIADLMSIDEIHIFDQTGTIYAGTCPKYYGYNFDSGEQMGFFKPMLKDKNLGMCQDVTPNTAEGKSMMYAIVWDSKDQFMVQVGIEPKRLIAALQSHRLSNVIQGIPLSEGLSIFAVNPQNRLITASTHPDLVGTKADMVFSNADQPNNGVVSVGSRPYYCSTKTIRGSIIAVTYDLDSNHASFLVPAAIVFLYMLIAALALFFLIRRIFAANQEKARRAAELQERVDEISALNTRLEEARVAANAASDAKTTFLFNMSHDIRTPMNAVVGFSELLERHQEDPVRRAEYLRKIKDSSAVLLSIINNVLEMAHIEKGVVTLEEGPWRGGSLTESMESIYGPLMEKKGISFTTSVNVQHRSIECDPVKLREVLDNLLSNALKYTNPGGTVSLDVTELPSSDPAIAVYQTTVTDTGIGMSPQFLPHLFEEFAREGDVVGGTIEGTGLGMPIVKRLVDAMGGSIQVESEKGVGSTFVLTLSHKILSEEAGEEPVPSGNDQHLLPGKRVLVAEDNDLNAQIIMEILQDAGMLVERAVDGAECLRMVESAAPDRYDLILMDIQMPNLNGYQASSAIRDLKDEGRASIPIVAMTANAFDEDRRQALEAGMNDHLSKPIEVQKMFTALSSALKGRP
ncbi:MAG: response regulator [Coriobacteriia bacterium]|nr:response regulator [Coriobacteriia bacterium]